MRIDNQYWQETKLNRRSFLNLVLVSAAGLAIGYGTGRWFEVDQKRSFSLQAFLPENETLLSELLESFYNLAGLPGNLHIEADAYLTQTIKKISNPNQFSRAHGFGYVKIIRMNNSVSADLVIGNNQITVFDPEIHYSADFNKLRQKIKDQAASWQINMLFKDLEVSANGKRIAVIRDQYGIFDRIPMDQDYQDIPVNGPYGKTHLSISHGHLAIHTSSCRQHLCQQKGSLAMPGDMTACAPNQLLVEIEMG